MSQITISEARASLPHLVEQAHSEAVTLNRRGERAAVLVSPQAYDRMMEALEDIADIADYDAAIEEEGPNIPWEQVKADLGLV